MPQSFSGSIITQAFAGISTAVKLAESGLQNDIPADCRIFLALIKAVETDIRRALDIQPDVSSLLLNDPGKKSWINGVIQSNLKALDEIGTYIHDFKASDMFGRRISPKDKLKYILGDYRRLVDRQRLLSICHGSLLAVIQEMHAILARSSHLSCPNQEAIRTAVGPSVLSPNMYAATPGHPGNHSTVSLATAATTYSSHYDAEIKTNPRISWDRSTVASVNGCDDARSILDSATDLGEELETENGCIFMFSPTSPISIERPKNDPVYSGPPTVYELDSSTTTSTAMVNGALSAQGCSPVELSGCSSPLILSPMQSISSQLSSFSRISPLTTPPTPPTRPPSPRRSARGFPFESSRAGARPRPRYRHWSDPPRSLLPGADRVRQARAGSCCVNTDIATRKVASHCRCLSREMETISWTSQSFGFDWTHQHDHLRGFRHRIPDDYRWAFISGLR